MAAVASFADARAANGEWLVRMEDLDPGREVTGAAAGILRTLEAFGLVWDGDILYQRRRTAAYAEALEALRRNGLTYPCGCSRGEIAARGMTGPEGPIYPGTCRSGLPPGKHPRSERLRIHNGIVGFDDRIHGRIEQDIAREVGDFVLRRADGVHAYQLAVVVDDAALGITQVVRGADLLLSTPRQILLQRTLGLPRPAYAHVPLVIDAAGRKLSKSLAAAPVLTRDPLPALRRAWRFLGQRELEPEPGSVAEFWQRALPLWSPIAIPAMRRIPIRARQGADGVAGASKCG